MPRNKFLKVGIVILATPVAIVAAAFWVLVAVWAWHQHSDSVRFASLGPYASELTLLPAPATLVDTHQTSESGPLNAGGPDYTLSIERDYAFKTLQSPQTVFSFYNTQLTGRGWQLDPSRTNTPDDSANRFTWMRAGTHSDTIFYIVIYYYDGSAPPVYGGGTAAPLELEIKSEPNNPPHT